MTEVALAREAAMADRGRRRAQAQIDKALERGDASDTPAAVALMKRGLQPLADAIRAFVAAADSGRAGRRHTAVKYLRQVDPEVAALITYRVALSYAVRGTTLTSAAFAVAERIELERIADQFENANSALYRSIVRNAQARGMAPARIAKAVELSNRKFNVVPREWNKTDKLHLGYKLVELLAAVTGLVEMQTRQASKLTRVNTLHLTAATAEWFAKYNYASTLARPMLLPAVSPPKPWTDIRGGAYYSPILRGGAIVTRAFKGQLEALQRAQPVKVYSALNAIQDTPWRVNRRVLEVMEAAWEKGLDLGCLPRRELLPLSEPPQEVKDDVKGGELRRAWRRKMRTIHETNSKSLSQRFEFQRALSIARENAGEVAIYFPHRLDFRGRVYASATTLNPQGPDEVRALLEFSEAKEVGEAGLRWLAIHGANCFGVDKVSLEERERWAFEHSREIAMVAISPLGNRWWTEADKPWSFLAWCFEFSEAQYLGAEFVSRLPIALDGSCNGIQHFSAMLRDEIGGAAVNLVPADKPQDIYQEVAQEVMRKLSDGAATYGPDQWICDAWFNFIIDRRITKRAVMVLPYGGTFKSCRDYVRAAVQERLECGQENPFGDQLWPACDKLAGIVWRSIGDVVVAARAAMSWLQAVSRVASKHGVALRWTTPSGFVAFQDYREVKSRRVRTRFNGAAIKALVSEDGSKIDPSRQATAIAPNFVHSMDASALMLTINACRDRGVTAFAMIHDSYGTHAADTETLARVLREEFVTMYQEDVLAKFRDEVAGLLPPEAVAELPPLPEKGTLDLGQVLRSQYFFA